MIQPPKRLVRHIQPVGPRVLVRVIKSSDIHESGLYLPAGAKDGLAEALYGEVIEVARAGTTETTSEQDGDRMGTNVSGVPYGAFVLFPKESGIKVPWDEDLRLLLVKEVLATVEEVPLEATH
jgi:co-chaperonin GroES (HSP10)